MNHSVNFSKEQVTELAQYIMEITRQGAAYKVSSFETGWSVEVVGY